MRHDGRANVDDIRRIVGDIGDAELAAIAEIGPSIEELEEAVVWAEAESDVMGKLGKSLSDTVARVYEVLITWKELNGEEDRR